MTLELAIVLVVRLLVPLAILRWPLWGGIAALLADSLDIVLITLIPLDGAPRYHQFDKYPDTYYLTIEAFVAFRRWPGWPRRITSALFAVRLLGFILFEVTGVRKFLFFFPNIFESFYLFLAVWDRFGRDWYILTHRWLVAWLIGLGSLRMLQEYFLHWRQSLDDVVAVHVIEDMAQAAFGDWLALTLALSVLGLAALLLLTRLVRRQVSLARARFG
ncbi:MAG TPA: hypothetical protein VNL15_07540 [Dehalococcoidia bacterium]|nr:hypothetical protein [Dehalococcoidia bacterium]